MSDCAVSHVGVVDLKSEYHQRLDAFEREVVRMPQIVLDVAHHFAPGVYLREMRAPAGAWITSKIHLTEHHFIVSKGALSVLGDDGKWTLIRAPFHGVTKPGTRRLAFFHEDTVWTTVHATDETDIEKIEGLILLDHTDHLGLNADELQRLKAIQRGTQPHALEENK